jgi:ABC-2 type transport system permease protein
LRIGVAEAFAYRAEFVIWVLTSTLPLIMLAIWTAAAQGGPVGRFGQADFVAYYLGALIVRQLTGSWVLWELAMEIRQGVLAIRLLRPIHPLLAYSAQSLAGIPLRAALAVPLALVLLAATGAHALVRDPVLIGAFVLSLFLAWLVQFLLMAAIATLGMFIQSALAVYDVWMGLFAVLSGYMIPLELLPRWARGAAEALPFRYMLGFPVEILTRGADRARAAAGLGVQAIYALGVAVAVALLWRAGTRRYEAYGG